METHISRCIVGGVHFIEVIKPFTFYLNKLTHQWHHHRLHLPPRPLLLGHGSMMYFLALEEKIPAILLWAISTRLLNKKVFTLTRMAKRFPEANQLAQP
ncbi:hypothetical protein L1887_15403 [Cichorium endivia]|nr:hypothetical protein L1887_15403 [Cichorium endivia]